MNHRNMDDVTLLHRYAYAGAEDAFAELVRRHVSLVYFAALRQCGGDAALAEEVAQTVFTDLARKARQLTDRPVLTGWLYTSTRFAAAKARRSESRRRVREQEAFAMQESERTETSTAAEWQRLRPVVDDALHTLDETDREAVLLRFFEGKGFVEIGAALRLSEDTARKRVQRALDKLAVALSRRGITSTTSALGLALGYQIGAAAPAGMAASVTGIALAGSAAVGGKSGSLAAASVAGVWTLSKVAIIIGSAALSGAGVWVAMTSARAEKTARAEHVALLREQDAMRARLLTLQERFGLAEQRARAEDADATELLIAIQEAAPKLGSGVFAAIKDTIAARPDANFVTLYDGDGRPMFGQRGWLAVNDESLVAIAHVLEEYQQDSVSNPVPGIYNAIRDAPSPTKTGARLHICVIGDEFNSADKEESALRRLQEVNPADADGHRRATISAVQLPTTTRYMGSSGKMGNTGLRFQSLMTEVARQHRGSFKLLGDDALK
jgi:RNA polymerase sigma factor (sigma-70 family)